MTIRRIAQIAFALFCGMIVVIVVAGRSRDKAQPQGGSLRLAYPNDPDTLNVLTSSDSLSETFQRQVYEPLADRDFADPDTWVPVLATSWEFDKEKLEFTIHLREGVKWQAMTLPDGRPLPETEFSSRDVKFAFDCILNPHVEAPHYRSSYLDSDPEDPNEPYLIEVEVVDRYTVKVRWKKPYFMAEAQTINIPILPRHVYSVDELGEPISFDFSSREFAEGFNNHWANSRMCGTGPMQLKVWNRGEWLSLVRNEDYWGKPYPFSRLVYFCIPNTNTCIRKALQGELDVVGISEKDLYLALEDEMEVKEGKVQRREYEYPGYRYVGYNLNRPLFQDVRFRTALSHAVPVRQIIDEVWKGLADPVTGPFLRGSSASDESLPPIAFDLEKSTSLLEEAGWRDTDGSGCRDKLIDGVRVEAEFELMIYADAPSYKTMAEIIQENFRKIGVRMNVVPAKWALMLQKIRKRSFDAVMLGWSMSWASDPKQIWHGDFADVPDSSNHIAYRNPEVDRAIDELRGTLDTDRQIELFHEIHRKIYEDQPYTFLFQEKRTSIFSAELKGVKFYKIRPCVDSREWRRERREAARS